MRLVIVAFALLFALLPAPVGAQSKAKGKSSTKATEETRRKDDEDAGEKSAAEKPAGEKTTGSKSSSATGAAAKKKTSGESATAKKPASESAAKKSPEKEAEGSAKAGSSKARSSDATSKASTNSSSKTATSGKKKSAEPKGEKPSAEEEDSSPPTGKGKTTTKSGTKGAKGSGEATSASDKTEKAAVTKATSTTAKSDTTNGRRKTSKGVDKPPQDNAGEEPTRKNRVVGANITLDPEDLANFDGNSKAVQRLLNLSLNLTRQGLVDRYGSSDPSTGGMDCSGTIYYLLKQAGVKEPPRDSSGLYLWVQKEGKLHQVNPSSLEDPVLAELRPGDLMFWEGTYEVQRDPPISHTMIYLGKEKATGMPVMVGASDGRTYGGVRRNGVSVFDFKLPRADSAARFVAYGRVPGIENLGEEASNAKHETRNTKH